MVSEDRESQLLEIEALENTLRPTQVRKLTGFDDEDELIRGIIQIDLETIADKPIEFRCLVERNIPEIVTPIKFLPPIRMWFEFPVDYPSSAPPKIEIGSNWMTMKQTVVCENAVEKTLLENEGMIILYFCVEAIIDAMKNLKIEFINLNRCYYKVLHETIPLAELVDRVFQTLSDVDEEAFQSNNHTCKVCFELFAARFCIRFYPCDHTFCKDCVSQYYKNLAEGMVTERMKCLANRCTSDATDAVIREVLGDELYARYDDALLQKALREGGQEAVECARESCKMVAYVTDREKNLVQCSYCEYNFCKNCRRTYHGVEECKITKEKASVIGQYDEADEEGKAALEEEYGMYFFDSHLNKEWIVMNTKPCPSCWVNVEKIDGCNKMRCTSCGGYFCWVCQTTITNGYAHFNNSGPCDGRLFDGLEDEEQ